MKEKGLKQDSLKNREGEKGAALVTVLLISFMLLSASAGLLLVAAANTGNVTDVTADQQAYNAAESGIQSVLNVLRGNTVANPLIDPTKPASDPANQIDFLKAINLAQSNTTGDSSTDARLSRWLSYNYTPSGGSTADRITLGSGTYDPQTGIAFNVTVEDPDNSGASISYSTVGSIDGSGNTKVFGSGADDDDDDDDDDEDKLTITYVPANINNLDVSSGTASTNFGRFDFSTTGSGAEIPDDVRFSIEVNMTVPFTATRVIRGFIKTGSVSNTSVGGVTIDFDSEGYVLMGSKFTLDNDPLTPNPPDTNSGQTTITGVITPAEPIRLLVRGIGMGPRGSRKELEAIVQRNFFNGMTAPATLTLVGSTTGFVFNPGSSNNTEYSGEDVVSDILIPPIGTTTDSNLDDVQDSVDGLPPHPFNGVVVGTPANIDAELPTWLKDPSNLDATVQALRNVASSSGRYFSNGQIPPDFGDVVNARGITFVDGDATFTGAGGGILIVTGKLTLKGNFDFNGLIIVTGAAGVARSGGGTGVLQGNIVVSPYDPNNLAAGFSGPIYDLSGGGTSEVVYNSSSLANGQLAVSNIVLGVVEK